MANVILPDIYPVEVQAVEHCIRLKTQMLDMVKQKINALELERGVLTTSLTSLENKKHALLSGQRLSDLES